MSHHVTFIWQARQTPHPPKSSRLTTKSNTFDANTPQQQLQVVLPRNLAYTTYYVSKRGRNGYKSIVSQASLTVTIWCGNHLLKPLFRSTIRLLPIRSQE